MSTNYNGVRELVVKKENFWGQDSIKRIEKVLERELSNEEVVLMLIHQFGYYDSSDKTVSRLAMDLDLERVLPLEDYNTLEDFSEDYDE